VVFVFHIFSMDFNLSFAENNRTNKHNLTGFRLFIAFLKFSGAKPSKTRISIKSPSLVTQISSCRGLLNISWNNILMVFVICRPRFLYDIFVVRHQIADMSNLRLSRTRKVSSRVRPGGLPRHVCKPKKRSMRV